MELPPVHPKMSFITGAIDKEIRLSFAQRIKGTLPEQYHALIPEGKEKDTPDFKYDVDSKIPIPSPNCGIMLISVATPYAKEGREILQLIRKKATDDEIQPLINSIEEQAREHGVADPMIPSTDAFVTSICYAGAKSLSHVLSCIERNKDRLLSIGPRSAAARRQIITSVLEYWRDQPGNGINIIDKLLNYTVLTPMSVLQWVLLDHLDAGRILAQSHIYEMVSATVGKVTNRLRQIVLARSQPQGLYEPQLSVLDETLKRERQDMQALFALIDDTVGPLAHGGNDQLMERSDADPATREENELLRRWAARWQRVFRRKAAVEEAFIQERMATAPPVGTMPPASTTSGTGENNAMQS